MSADSGANAVRIRIRIAVPQWVRGPVLSPGDSLRGSCASLCRGATADCSVAQGRRQVCGTGLRRGCRVWSLATQPMGNTVPNPGQASAGVARIPGAVARWSVSSTAVCGRLLPSGQITNFRSRSPTITMTADRRSSLSGLGSSRALHRDVPVDDDATAPAPVVWRGRRAENGDVHAGHAKMVDCSPQTHLGNCPGPHRMFAET